MSDAELWQRMITSHLERYGETFWEFFTAQVQTRLPFVGAREKGQDLGRA
jgi:hypothetical protein